MDFLEYYGFAARTRNGLAVRVAEHFPIPGKNGAILFLIYYAIEFALIVANNATAAYIHSRLADFLGVSYVKWRLIVDNLVTSIVVIAPKLLFFFSCIPNS